MVKQRCQPEFVPLLSQESRKKTAFCNRKRSHSHKEENGQDSYVADTP